MASRSRLLALVMSSLCCALAMGSPALGAPPVKPAPVPAALPAAPPTGLPSPPAAAPIVVSIAPPKTGIAEWCAAVARDELDPAAVQGMSEATAADRDAKQARQKRLQGLSTNTRKLCVHNVAHLSSGEAVAEEVLRSVAQVILNRATRAGWQVLDAKLKEAARCPTPGVTQASPTVFPASCKVLDTLTIQDLVSSPAVLLNAVVTDILVQAGVDTSGAQALAPILGDVLRQTASQFSRGRPANLVDAFQTALQSNLETAAGKDCNAATPFVDKALWVAGECLVEAGQPDRWAQCHPEAWIKQCDPNISDTSKTDILTITTMIGNIEVSSKQAPDDYVDLIFTLADLAVDLDTTMTAPKKANAKEYIAGLRTVFVGLSTKDWVQATSGAVRVVRVLYDTQGACATDAAGGKCVEAKGVEKVFTLVAAVGNYAETFATKDPTSAGAQREKIIEELVDRMVNRTDRDHGLVVSLGGNLGVFGGARTTDFKSAQVAFPLQLGVGLGFQSYGAKTGGFHGMLTAIDLGQYVSLQSGALKVDAPKVESAVMVGATLGGWVALRETPWYIGAFGGVSPFVRTNDKMTGQLGLVTGIYVPLLDFN